jgi:hypothetical protein
VQLDIPLLPFVIDVRWRPLPPLRPRFTVLGLIVAVGVAGFFFSLRVKAERLHRRGSYHAEQSILVTIDRTPDDLRPTSDWHASQSNRYHDATLPYERLMAAILLASASLGVAAIFGRILHRLNRRRVARAQE